jgi:hypothetical protein
MVDYAVAHEAAVRKATDLVIGHGDIDASWELWDTYVSEQPAEVAEALRRDPYFEAVRVATVWSRRIAIENAGGPPVPDEVWGDLRRPGRAEFVGERDEVQAEIASFFSDMESEARRQVGR